MPVQSKFAAVEQDNPSKVPVLLTGDLNADVMREYENACLGFFESKDIANDKQVRKILAGLRDNRMQDWISADRDRFIALSFPDFMKEFRAAYLPEDWEEIVRIELLGMTQGNDMFWDFAVAVQAKNSLLRQTDSYLAKEHLRHRIESGMNQKLALRCRLEKSSKVVKFEDWLVEIKRVDDLMRAERADFEALAKATREVNRRANTLSEPSRRANTNYQPGGPSIKASYRPTLSRLLDSERQLLYDNQGCLKCHRVFVTHRSNNCPNDFPKAETYKVLTQAAIDAIKLRVKKPFAAVIGQEMHASGSGSSMGNSSINHPVAAVMGISNNPVAYMPSNASNVVEGDSDSDSSVSAAALIGIEKQHKSPGELKASPERLAPLTVPHLFWRCTVSGPADSFPITFNALIDHGSHTVLISEEFVRTLSLKR